jgi:hypothetical protein
VPIVSTFCNAGWMMMSNRNLKIKIDFSTPRSRNGAVELQHNAKAQGQGSAVRAAGQFSHMAHPQSTS